MLATSGQKPGYDVLIRNFERVHPDAHEYVVSPISNWWNANVLLSLQQDGIGLITGQRSIDDVLGAMDAAGNRVPRSVRRRRAPG